ncbi:nucleotide exchange factor GrpE [Pusillimonas sp. CC-YST705]|uniref:Protein GrpE n=1 Tax=Mesopusillimonas faecipullorum TaxID=2755040 RepID=A0ABS8C919_9BURK|nr:nucleotide exchange factor GrpE [Mesopusillimonas faecipullorum]MCB5362314.1 nucleotide exchange factor GrpE [Mesopusillimonas faecipullorum]
MSDKNQSVDPQELNQAEAGQDPAAQTDGAETFAPEEDLVAKLDELQAQVAQYHDELLRARAEVENVRRRSQDDVAKARKFGTESFAESLIPVRDSLEAALAAPEQTLDSWREGVEVTLRQLTNAFERNLLKEVAPEPGEKFDPNMHQAISAVPSEFAEGMVAQRLQKGYTIAERVLRPALVMVSSGSAS